MFSGRISYCSRENGGMSKVRLQGKPWLSSLRLSNFVSISFLEVKFCIEGYGFWKDNVSGSNMFFRPFSFNMSGYK